MGGAARRPGAWWYLRLGRVSIRLPRRLLPVGSILLLLILATMVVSVGVGEYHIGPVDVVRATLGLETGNPDHALVVRTFRLPRIVLAALVGAALALSGAVLQGITRNGLAEPGVLGINQGAGLAAVALLTLAPSASVALLPWLALAGGLIAALLIYLLAWNQGAAPIRLLLVGIGIGAVASAATTFMIVYGDIIDVQRALFWLTGSVYGRTWEHVRMLGAWMLVLAPLLLLCARALNVLALGDAPARALGQRVELARGILIVAAVALATGAVSVAGTVAFAGLVAPHAARRLVGPAFEALLPASALFGALLLLLADLIGRTVIAPSQLPVGIVTAVIGAPYLLFLLWRQRSL
ncbi:MAG TPA: iron ABC transporter permease [Trueperaceae bacterium]